VDPKKPEQRVAVQMLEGKVELADSSRQAVDFYYFAPPAFLAPSLFPRWSNFTSSYMGALYDMLVAIRDHAAAAQTPMSFALLSMHAMPFTYFSVLELDSFLRELSTKEQLAVMNCTEIVSAMTVRPLDSML